MNDFIVSARKYRPQNFDQVVGQSAITSTLTNAIKDGHLAQSFLFCGPRGVGKTTCARILAKTINCNNVSDIIIACNNCESCISFDKNNSFNIHELDAASNNSVDDIRKLVDQVRFAPQVGKYNIYIIDEVHMLSSSAFNAFLKTLEEPPSHAIFILATTEKHKIIPTILSRCQIFDFKNILNSDIINHLDYVSNLENICSEKEALNIIAQKSEGSLRDALSMFDRLVNSSNLTLTYKDVIDNLNILDHDYYFDITDDLINNNIYSVLLKLDEIIDNGFDGHQFIIGLASHLRDLLVCKNPETVKLIDQSKELRERYLQQSQLCEIGFLIRSLKEFSKCDLEYKRSKNQRLNLELSLLNVCSIDSSVIQKKKFKKIIETEHSNDSLILSDSNSNFKEEKKSTTEVDSKLEEDKKNTKDLDVKKKPKKVSFSITENLRSEQSGSIDDDSNKNTDKVSDDKINDAFRVLSKSLKKEGRTNLYITIIESNPLLIDGSLIQINIMNNAQEKIIDDNKAFLLSFLRKELNNYLIDIKTMIRKDIEGEKKLYTSIDVFKDMIKNNRSLKVLQEKLGLDPDY